MVGVGVIGVLVAVGGSACWSPSAEAACWSPSAPGVFVAVGSGVFVAVGGGTGVLVAVGGGGVLVAVGGAPAVQISTLQPFSVPASADG